MERIDSRASEKVKALCRLRDSAGERRARGAFLAEGLRLCTDLAESCPVQTVLFTEKALAGCPALAQLGGREAERVLIGPAVAEKLADTRASQGVFAVFALPQMGGAVAPGSRCLVLEHVQNPDNVGALARSAAAFGFGRLMLCGACADPFSPKALRASMGALARLRLHRFENVPAAAAALRAAGVPLWAAALDGSRPLDEMPAPGPAGAALLIGNEGSGLSGEALAAADGAVRIPMAAGVESLNAAVAGGVLLWHLRRRT